MTEAELLEAIWQRPNEDAPRLVYADWLHERGDPRGEFIHLQCASTKRTAELGERERSLERAHSREWSEPFTRLGVRVVGFHRGLPDFLAANAKVWVEHGETLLRMAPISRISGMGEQAFQSLAPLFALPEFARIYRLDLGGCAGGDTLAREVAQSPNARGLRFLNVWKTGLTRVGVEALSSSPHLTQMDELVLGGQPIGGDSVSALARSKMRSLRELSFYECRLRDEEWRGLADSPAFANVKKINFSGNTLGEMGARALSRSTSLLQLEELELARHSVHDDGAVALSAWPGLRSLRTLNLSDNLIGDAGAEAFARSPMLSLLRHLDLSANQIRASGGRALAESTTLSSLMSLNVRGNELQVEGVTAFVEGRGLPALQHLSISQNGILTGTNTEHSDWDGTVTGGSADEEGPEATRKRFVSKPGLGVS